MAVIDSISIRNRIATHRHVLGCREISELSTARQILGSVLAEQVQIASLEYFRDMTGLSRHRSNGSPVWTGHSVYWIKPIRALLHYAFAARYHSVTEQ